MSNTSPFDVRTSVCEVEELFEFEELFAFDVPAGAVEGSAFVEELPPPPLQLAKNSMREAILAPVLRAPRNDMTF